MPKQLTVADVVEEMKESHGFVLFVSLLIKQADGSMALEHRYMRQTYVPEDLEKTFQSFNEMVLKDMAESGMNLIKRSTLSSKNSTRWGRRT